MYDCRSQSRRESQIVGKSISLATAILIGHCIHHSVYFHDRVMNGFKEIACNNNCVPGSPTPERVSNNLVCSVILFRHRLTYAY